MLVCMCIAAPVPETHQVSEDLTGTSGQALTACLSQAIAEVAPRANDVASVAAEYSLNERFGEFNALSTRIEGSGGMC